MFTTTNNDGAEAKWDKTAQTGERSSCLVAIFDFSVSCVPCVRGCQRAHPVVAAVM